MIFFKVHIFESANPFLTSNSRNILVCAQIEVLLYCFTILSSVLNRVVIRTILDSAHIMEIYNILKYKEINYQSTNWIN